MKETTSEGTPYRYLRQVYIKDMGYFYGASYPNSTATLKEHPNNGTVTYTKRDESGHLLEFVFNSAHVIAREYE